MPKNDEITVATLEQTVENAAPERVYKNFDEFFQEYALKNGIPLAWKESVKQHAKSINCLKNQADWPKAVKHFGI